MTSCAGVRAARRNEAGSCLRGSFCCIREPGREIARCSHCTASPILVNVVDFVIAECFNVTERLSFRIEKISPSLSGEPCVERHNGTTFDEVYMIANGSDRLPALIRHTHPLEHRVASVGVMEYLIEDETPYVLTADNCQHFASRIMIFVSFKL